VPPNRANVEAPTIGFMISEPTSEFGSWLPETALRLASQSGLELSWGVGQASGTEGCAGLSQSQYGLATLMWQILQFSALANRTPGYAVRLASDWSPLAIAA